MKVIKVRVKIHPNGAAWARKNNEAVMQYPTGYMDLDFARAGYVEENGITYVLGYLDETQTAYATVSQSADVMELNKADAIAFSEANEERFEEVTDEGKIKRLTIKSQLGQAFTQAELDAIDPTKPTKGINNTEIFADYIADKTVKAVVIG